MAIVARKPLADSVNGELIASDATMDIRFNRSGAIGPDQGECSSWHQSAKSAVRSRRSV